MGPATAGVGERPLFARNELGSTEADAVATHAPRPRDLLATRRLDLVVVGVALVLAICALASCAPVPPLPTPTPIPEVTATFPPRPTPRRTPTATSTPSPTPLPGAPWAWGLNDFGQLGRGTTGSSAVARPVEGLSDV